jgi:hypothetical protein
MNMFISDRCLAGLLKPIILSGVCVMSVACSNMETLEKDSGVSVRQMEAAQIYNQENASNPSDQPVMGIDGTKALADLNEIERPVIAEKQMESLIKSKTFIIGK